MGRRAIVYDAEFLDHRTRTSPARSKPRRSSNSASARAADAPNFRSDDPAGCREFYEDLLGLDLAMDMDWIATFVSPNNPTAQVTLIRKDATAAVHPDASIEVEDVDAVHARVIASGYEILHPLTDEPWGVRRFFVRDPNGVVVNVMSHR